MSFDVGIAFVMHFFNMTWDEVVNLYVSMYNFLLDQSFNLLSAYRQGSIELLNVEDRMQLADEYKQWKKFNKGK